MNQKIDYGKPPSYTFAGCGFLGLYHVGVASCLREYAPINRATQFAGASAGSLAAMALACELPLGENTSEILSVAIKARSRALGPFHPSFDINKIIYDLLLKTLPEDAHLKANGRLSISVTRMSDGKNVIINKFKSKEELIKAVQCSCFIPIWSGLIPPKFNGIAYIDGGASDNLPMIDENTVRVSPFAGESDICPRDDTYNLFQVNFKNTSIAFTAANMYRLTRILFPAHPEVLSKMCQQGFDDALRYLQRNNKISCTRCLAIHLTLEKENEEVSKHEKHNHPDRQSLENCRDCEYRRQIAVLDSLPEGVVQAIQEACDQVNKGVINWLFRHKPMKMLSLLSIPYLLPIDITIVIFFKIYEKIPDIKRELKNSLMRLISFLKSLLVKMESKRYLYSAKFSCQLAVKEFDYGEETTMRVRKPSVSSSLPRKKSSIKSPKVEKSNSFSGRKNNDIRSLLSAERKSMENVNVLNLQRSESDRSRKVSYAGREFNKNIRQSHRRKSMIEIGNIPGHLKMPPERVISQLKFDFKMDMKDPEKRAHDTFDSSVKVDEKVLNIDLKDMDQTNAIEIANTALDWEKQFLQKCQKLNESDGNFNRMFEITRKQDAVMAYYYTDENNKVKFTELFNIKEDDLKKINDQNQNLSTLPMQQHIVYKDSDDGLMETAAVTSANLSSLSTHSLPASVNGPPPTSPSKRQRKKSVILID